MQIRRDVESSLIERLVLRFNQFPETVVHLEADKEGLINQEFTHDASP
jgi:hypothetical protein